MNVFNSLGSNYSPGFIRSSLFGTPNRATTNLPNLLAKRYGAKSVYLTYKGREAIAIILKKFNLPAGSYVAVNGYTCYAVYDAIVAAGLQPYYVDIAKDELNFSANQLQSAIKGQPNIKCVIIQNTLGIPAEGQAIRRFCQEQKLPLIEDLAHCAGLRYATGEEAGTIGDASALSFSQDKMIDAVAGGAAVFTTEQAIKEDWPAASWWQRTKVYWYPLNMWLVRKTIGVGFGKIWLRVLKDLRLIPRPMDGSAEHPHMLSSRSAGLATRAFNGLPDTIKHRQQIAQIYREQLPKDVQFKHLDGAVYLRFPIKVKSPAKLIAHLRLKGIYVSDIWYDAPVAPKKYQSKTNYKPGSCLNAEAVAQQMVNLPTHINVSEKQAQLISQEVIAWLR